MYMVLVLSLAIQTALTPEPALPTLLDNDKKQEPHFQHHSYSVLDDDVPSRASFRTSANLRSPNLQRSHRLTT